MSLVKWPLAWASGVGTEDHQTHDGACDLPTCDRDTRVYDVRVSRIRGGADRYTQVAAARAYCCFCSAVSFVTIV